MVEYIVEYMVEYIDREITETEFPNRDESVQIKASNIFQTPLHDECNIKNRQIWRLNVDRGAF